jgi:hypothetical protein
LNSFPNIVALSCPCIMSWISYPLCLIQSDQSGWPVLVVLRYCLVSDVLTELSCRGCPTQLTTVMFWACRPLFPVLAVSSDHFLFPPILAFHCPDCPLPFVLSRMSYPSYPVPAALSQLSCPPAVLSQLFCPSSHASAPLSTVLLS